MIHVSKCSCDYVNSNTRIVNEKCRVHSSTHDLLIRDVIDWGRDKGIISANDKKSQCLKTISECGELADAVCKGDENINDHVGDIIVTLILLCEMHGTDIMTALRDAYNEIKNRTGEMKNGTFIKHTI